MVILTLVVLSLLVWLWIDPISDLLSAKWTKDRLKKGDDLDIYK